MSFDNQFIREAIPVIRYVADMADKFRKKRSEPLEVVGEVISAINQMTRAKQLDDDERIAHLEAIIVSLATGLYRQHKSAFIQAVQEAAELETIGILKAMKGQSGEVAP